MSYESDGDFFGLASAMSKGLAAVIFGVVAVIFWLAALSQRTDCASKVCPYSDQRPAVVDGTCLCASAPLVTASGAEVFAAKFPEVHGMAQAAGAELGRQAIRRGRIDEEILRRADTIQGGRLAMLEFLAGASQLPPELGQQVAQALIDTPSVGVVYLGPASKGSP